jgi:hypothetical protein
MAVAAALDAADSILQSIGILERYITLTVPKMEDGGNFGVSVQLNAIKVLTDASKKIEDGMEELYKYASARADAMEKCKMHPSVSTTKTTTNTQTTNTGNDSEKGDTQNNSNAQTNEEKTVESQTTTIEASWRKQAVTMVDVRFYNKAKAVRLQTFRMGDVSHILFSHTQTFLGFSCTKNIHIQTFTNAITGYMAVCDFMDKNKEKIDKPKGESGSRGYSGTMY